MTNCFVMQVFDGGPYDRRYEETFAPAIKKGGAVPVRADKILGTRPIIEKIETAIQSATVAFAEISEDNANVFTELGYALSLNIPLVIVCDKSKRSQLPFDIGHRPVLFYKTESQGDFEQLSRDIDTSIGAALLDANERKSAVKILPDQQIDVNSDVHKNRVMLEILEAEIGDPDGLSAHRIKATLALTGVSERLTSLVVLALTTEGMIEAFTATDYNDGQYVSYRLSESGRTHLLAQYAEIKRTEEARQPVSKPKARPSAFDSDLDDDVPF